MDVKIGEIIDARPDGSFIYMSSRGVLNLDNSRELDQEMEEDKKFLGHYLPQIQAELQGCHATPYMLLYS